MSDERKRIYELDSAETIASNDSLIIDNPNRDEAVKIPVNSFKTLLTQTQYDALPSSKNTDGIVYYITDNNKIMLNGNAYGGGGDVVELTQAEYDALPDTKLTDGVLYAIKDAEAPSVVTDVTVEEESLVDENGVAKLDSLTAIGSASGAIATFTDGSNLPMPTLKIGIEPQQDLHGYDNPWVGGAGKNKLPKSPQTGSNTINGITWAVNDDGSIKVSGTATARSLFYYLPTGSYDTLNGEYTVSLEGMTEEMNNGFLIGGNWRGARPAFTTTYENATIQEFWIDVAQGTTVNTTIKPMIRLASVTDATYEPYSNICPISGFSEANVTRTGENLWGGEKLADDIVAKVPNATKDATNKTISYAASYISDKILFTAFKPNTRYTFYMKSSSTTNLYIYYTDGTNGYLSPNKVVTSDSGKSVDRIQGYWVIGYTTLNYEDCGVFEGVLTAQDFEPYNGNTYNIQFRDGDNPLTVYGGTLDVVSGELTVDKAYVDLGSLTFTKDNSSLIGVPCFYATIPNVKAGAPYIACSSYILKRNRYLIDASGQITPGNNSDATYCVIRDDTYANVDATAFKQAMNGVQLVYELATPLTYQLTPTQVKSLLGSNNVWADCGDVIDGKYVRNLTAIIDYILSQLEG